MLLDQNAVLSEEQAVSATAPSTQIMDLTAAGDAVPGSLFFVARVAAAFTGEGTLKIALQTASDSAFTNPIELLGATYGASLLGTKDQTLCAVPLPAGVKRYVRAYYTVSNVSGGKLSCFITDGVTQ